MAQHSHCDDASYAPSHITHPNEAGDARYKNETQSKYQLQEG